MFASCTLQHILHQFSILDSTCCRHCELAIKNVSVGSQRTDGLPFGQLNFLLLAAPSFKQSGSLESFRTTSQAQAQEYPLTLASVNDCENGHYHVLHRAHVRATRARGPRVQGTHGTHDRETRAHGTRGRGTCDHRPAPRPQHDRGHDPTDCHRNLPADDMGIWSFQFCPLQPGYVQMFVLNAALKWCYPACSRAKVCIELHESPQALNS